MILPRSYYTGFFFDELSNFLCWKYSQSSEPYHYAVKKVLSKEQSHQNVSLSKKPNEKESVLFLIPFIWPFLDEFNHVINLSHKFLKILVATRKLKNFGIAVIPLRLLGTLGLTEIFVVDGQVSLIFRASSLYSIDIVDNINFNWERNILKWEMKKSLGLNYKS